MKFGFNLLLWTGHVTEEHAPIIRRIAAAGYDGVEIPLFEGTPDHYARLGEIIAKAGLEVTTVSVIGPGGKNPLSPDKAHQKAAVEYAKWAVDCTAALGAPILAGPMHSEIGYFSGNGPTTAGKAARRQLPSTGRRLCGEEECAICRRGAQPLRMLLPQHHGAAGRASRRGGSSRHKSDVRHLPRQHRGEGPGGRDQDHQAAHDPCAYLGE